MGPDDYSCFPQLLFPILLQLLLKSFLQENLTPRGGVSVNTKRGKKSVPGRAGRFHPRVSGAGSAPCPGGCAAAPACPGAAPRRPHSSRRENSCSGRSQTPRPAPAALTLWSRLKREREREGAEEGGKEEGGGEPKFAPVINPFPADGFPGAIRYLPAAGTATYLGD